MVNALKTLLAAVRSVATAGTLASSGFYLHRREILKDRDKKVLALFSKHVAIPALFFTNIIQCPQNFTTQKCPNVINNLGNTWILLFWPLFVVGCGLVIGEIVVRLTDTPPRQRAMVLASCALANSTGLPLTLLTVVYQAYPPSSKFAALDPTMFLSVYLVLYPMLQWSVGGWLLGPREETAPSASLQLTAAMSEDTLKISGHENSEQDYLLLDDGAKEDAAIVGEAPTEPTEPNTPKSPSASMKFFSQVLQPPVVAALLGLFVAAVGPIRGILVDTGDRDHDAFFQWFYDGLFSVGKAAVPVNMAILGINLSSAFKKNDNPEDIISRKTIIGVVCGKLIVMPLIGILTTWLLRTHIWPLQDEMYDFFYMVLILVTATPTANNVMVMAELSGCCSKDGMAKLIGFQYMFAPLLLSATVAVAVRIAGLP